MSSQQMQNILTARAPPLIDTHPPCPVLSLDLLDQSMSPHALVNLSIDYHLTAPALGALLCSSCCNACAGPCTRGSKLVISLLPCQPSTQSHISGS